MDLPALPAGGPLRTLAIAGSLAILGFIGVAASEALARRFVAAGWAAAPLVLAIATVLVARASSLLHLLLSLTTLGVTLASLRHLSGAKRAIQALSGAAWLVALLAARALFH